MDWKTCSSTGKTIEIRKCNKVMWVIHVLYKQVRPLATLASLRALRPAYGRPQHAQCVEMCVYYGTVKTCYACHCMALCKAPISFPPHPPATWHRNGC